MAVASNTTATQPPLEPLKAEPGQDGMLNRLLRWVDRLPIPYPVFCLGVWVGCMVLFQGMLAFSTHQPPWPLNLNSILNAFVLAYCLGLTLHVQRSVRQSLAAFAPVLDLDQEGYARLRADLISIPTRPALLCGLLVVLTALVGNYFLGSDTIRAALSVAPIMISSAAVVSLTYGVVGILMCNLIRELWLIGRIYPLAGRLDLNKHRSLYAFSGLTARIWAG